MEREKFERKQVLRNGEPNVRYTIEERIDDGKIVLMAVPTPAEEETVRQMRIREALIADPTLGGKIVEPVWTGEFDNGSGDNGINKE